MLDTKTYYEAYWADTERAPFDDAFAPARLALLRTELAGSTKLRILDAGCGTGAVAGGLAADGHASVGMDIADLPISLARAEHPDVRFVEHSIEALPWPVEPASQDVVVSFEVIEHLVCPRVLLDGAYAALRLGGLLVLTTPYHGRAKNLALALRGFDRHFAVEGDHLRFFTDRALVRMLEESGFALERIEHIGRFRPLWADTFVVARKR